MGFGKHNFLFFALAIICFGATAQCSAQSEPIQWKLAAGDQFKVTLNQTSSADTKVDSRKTKIQNATTLEMDWDVLKVTDGDAKIEQSIAAITLNVSNPAVPAQAVALSTTASDVEAKEFSKTSRALLKQIKPLIGLKFHVTMAASGQIKEVTLPDATSEVLNKLPDTVRLRQLFSPEGLTQILGASAIVFPDKAIETGGSWTDKKAITTPLGAFSRDRTYTLVGEKSMEGDNLIEIKMKPTMTAQQSDEERKPGSAFEGKLVSFTGSGTLLVDAKNGYLKSSSFENELESERLYREKKIETVVKNQIQMTVRKTANKADGKTGNEK